MVGQQSEPPGTARRSAIDSLTGLRFVAALLVAVSHFPEVIPFADLRVGLERQGAAGVTIFFVLSGFVLTYNYMDDFSQGVGTRSRFYRNRFARIFPVYFVGLVLITPLVIATADEVPSVGSWLVNAAMLESLVPSKQMHLWNIPAWSVSSEVAFYVLFPLIIALVLARTRSHRWLPLLAAAVFAIEVLLFAVTANVLEGRLRRSGHDDEAISQVLERVKFFPGLRVWEFVLGCLAGAAYLRVHARPQGWWVALGSQRVRNGLLVLVVAGITAIMLIPTFAEPNPSGLAHHFATSGLYVLYTPLALLLVVTLAWGPTAASPVLESSPAKALGDASYSFYILQWILFTIVTQTALAIEPRTWWYSTMVIVVLIGLSLASHRWIERPANSWLRAGRARPRLGTPDDAVRA